MFTLGDALVVVDDLGDDEPQELLGERRIETRLLRERAQAGELDLFTARDRRARDAPSFL